MIDRSYGREKSYFIYTFLVFIKHGVFLLFRRFTYDTWTYICIKFKSMS